MLKKKVTASTLAAGLALGSIASVPLNVLNTPVLFGISNVRVAYAAGLPAQAGDFTAKLQAIHSKILPEDLADVRAARDKWKTVKDHPELVQAVWTKISAKKGTSTEYDMVTEAKVAEFISQFGIMYDSDLSRLEAIRTNDDYRKLMNQLAKLGGVDQGLNVIGFPDIINFYTAVENKFKGKLQSMTVDQLIAIGLNRNEVSRLINESVTEIMADQSLTFSKILAGLGISADDVISAKNSLGTYTDPQQKARNAFAIAYLRTQAGFTSTASSDGRTVTPKLTILGKEVPGSVLTWSVVSGDTTKVSVDANGNFVLGSGSTTATVMIKAETKFIVKKLLEHSLTLTAVSSGGDSNTQTPSTPPKVELPPDVQESMEKLQEKINDIKTELQQKLANLPAEQQADEAEKAAREARDLIADEIRKLATIDMTSFVKEIDGKKVLSLGDQDKQQITELMKAIQQQAKSLNDALTAIDPSSKPAVVEITFNMGQGSEAELTIPKDILDAASANGIGRVTGQFNGLGLSYDTSNNVTGDLKLSVKKLDASAIPSDSALTIGSDIYELEAYVDGKQLTSLSKPMVLRIPVKNANGFDQERLVAVKIVDGKPQVVGGMFDSAGGFVEVERNSLSAYAVIENKVTFNDVDSVKAWAGRPIEVTAAKGVFNGRLEEQFFPNENVTRAEFAKMIVTMFNLEDSAATEAFTDVYDDDWFRPYVAVAAKLGIVKGRSADMFDPNSPVTRAEMATMTARALKIAKDYRDAKNAEDTLGSFRDADKIAASLRAGVALMVKEELMQGVREGVFNPNGYATRAQAAVLLYRVLNSK